MKGSVVESQLIRVLLIVLLVLVIVWVAMQLAG
jgi:hypothetical protein